MSEKCVRECCGCTGVFCEEEEMNKCEYCAKTLCEKCYSTCKQRHNCLGTLKVEIVSATLAEANEIYVKELKDAGKLMSAEEVKEMDLFYKDWAPYDDVPGDKNL